MSTPPTQQLIKDVAALKQKKFRDARGLILVEGKHPIEEAFRAGLKLHDWFALNGQPYSSLPAFESQFQRTNHNQMPQGKNDIAHKQTLAGSIPSLTEPYRVDESTMSRMSSTSSPPPCLAVFEKPAPCTQLQGTLVLLLDGIQDPGNLGTLVRSAVAFGVDTMVLSGASVEAFNPKVIRASAGLVFALPILEYPHAALPKLLPEGDWALYTTTGAPTATPYRNVDYAGRCVIVLGNEGRGVSPDLFAGRTVQSLTIPMNERVESLNVSISGSIIMAEAAAHRRTQHA